MEPDLLPELRLERAMAMRPGQSIDWIERQFKKAMDHKFNE